MKIAIKPYACVIIIMKTNNSHYILELLNRKQIIRMVVPQVMFIINSWAISIIISVYCTTNVTMGMRKYYSPPIDDEFSDCVLLIWINSCFLKQIFLQVCCRICIFHCVICACFVFIVKLSPINLDCRQFCNALYEINTN